MSQSNVFATQPLQMSEGKAAIQGEGSLMSLRLGWVAQLVQTAPLQELFGDLGEPVKKQSPY